MNFDTVIIGGGLAGLLCGITLTGRGQRVAIVSRGRSALSFSSGSLDLLSHLPTGEVVTDLNAGLARLSDLAPAHPYALLGPERVIEYAQETQRLLAGCGLVMQGSVERPHFRVTPLGGLRRAWLSPQEVPIAPSPGMHVGIVGIEGFLDFQPALAAAGLRRLGVTATAHEITLPALDILRGNPSEFRAVTIARTLDDEAQFAPLCDALRSLSREHDVLWLPACFGLADGRVWTRLNEVLQRKVQLLPTLPPSVFGMRMQTLLQRQFINNGGVWLPGDEVLNATVSAGRIGALWTRKHEDIPLCPRHVVLASGSFFSNGLVAERRGIREAVLGLEVQQPERGNWTRHDLFAAQPWEHAGVRTDNTLRGWQHGERLENLYVAGSVLGGFDAITQGCGGGICAVTALHAAQQICARESLNEHDAI